MPNTLVHLGIQGATSGALVRNADLKRIYVGRVIPDIPWILRRAARKPVAEINLIDLRRYRIVKASFVFSAVLAVAIATLSKHFKKTAMLLVFNVEDSEWPPDGPVVCALPCRCYIREAAPKTGGEFAPWRNGFA